MIFIIFFIGGLIIGSFLNVIIYRLRIFDDILGRSHCPHCKSKIRWYDNIPLLSFVLLRAKCRDCEGKISWQYPLVEFFTGVVFALTGYYFFDSADLSTLWETGFYLIIFSLLMVLLTYDWLYMEVPILIFWIILGAIAVNLIFVFWGEWEVVSNFWDYTFLNNILGGFVAWLFFFSLVFFSKEKWMGWGDVYVGLLVGLILGWPSVLLGLMLAFTLGAIYALILLAGKKVGLKTEVPFIPFLVAGVVVGIFLTEQIPLWADYFYF
ncbi:MAG: prepilin peptidase [Candidatus Moraniibacteriota bacterium]